MLKDTFRGEDPGQGIHETANEGFEWIGNVKRLEKIVLQ